MTGTLATIAIRLALCAFVAWLAWRWAGAVGLALSAALLGLALARPLLDLAGALRHGIRTVVWKPLEGRFFAYHGHAVQVLEDPDHCRWVRAADVRAIVGLTSSDGALALSYPSGWCLAGAPPEPHISDEALLLHLAKERSTDALRFARWAEREIVFPARRQRERLGIRLPPPTAPLAD